MGRKRRRDESESEFSSEPERKRKKKKKSKKKKSKKKKNRKRSQTPESQSFFAPQKQKRIETKEEKRARRKREKAEKDRKEKEMCEKNYFGYDNLNNPYGDPNLTELFVWDKKYQHSGLSRQKIRELQIKKREDQREKCHREILQVRKRKEDRAQKQADDEETKQLIAAELEQERNADWKTKEAEYHQKTAIERAKKRVTNHRPSPIDIICCVIHKVDLDQKLVVRRIRSPVEILELLSDEQLSELLKQLMDFESIMEDHFEHWANVRVVAEHQQKKLRGEQKNKKSMKNVAEEVETMLAGFNPDELEKLEAECRANLSGDLGIAIDVEYWEEVSRLCEVYKCMQRLKRYYTQYLDMIQERTRQKKAEAKAKGLTVEDEEGAKNKKRRRMMTISYVEDTHIPFIVKGTSRYKDLLPLAKPATDDKLDLEKLRAEVLKKMAKKVLTTVSIANPMKYEQSTLSAIQQISQRADRTLVDNKEQVIEVNMKNDVAIPLGQTKVYLWHQKYQPRKPEYFNRVKTGFSWTKYNQAHYNIENPPPKVVIGYKFNVFYPDLIDKSKAPEFKVYEEEGSLYATIVFRGGPPYEDIAFRIVNNEWDYANHRGYRCRFENGIFSLYFNFKRRRYRR